MTQPTFVPTDNTAKLNLSTVRIPHHSTVAEQWAAYAAERYLTDRLHATITLAASLSKIQPRPLTVSSAGDPA